jgi:hypothetical protein
VLKQNPKLVDRFAWTSRLDPNSKKLLERADRETFSHVCRKHDVSEIEANFKLLVEVLGAGFSEYAAAQAIQSNAVSLSPATPADLTKWRVEPEGAANNAALLGQKTTTVKTHTAKNEHRRQPQPSAVSKRCLPSAEKCTEGRDQGGERRWHEESTGVNRETRAVRQKRKRPWRRGAPSSCHYSEVVKFCADANPPREYRNPEK